MKGEARELWQRLCEQAAVEQDHEKLLQVTQEINRLLNEKEERAEEPAIETGRIEVMIYSFRFRCLLR